MTNLDASVAFHSRNDPYSTPRKRPGASNAEADDGGQHFHDRVLDSFGCPTEGGRDICDSSQICHGDDGVLPHDVHRDRSGDSILQQARFISRQITIPVRVCMFLLFSKMFTVESVISAGSMVTENRYWWAVQQVGTLGTIVGCLTIPISVFIGWGQIPSPQQRQEW